VSRLKENRMKELITKIKNSIEIKHGSARPQGQAVL